MFQLWCRVENGVRTSKLRIEQISVLKACARLPCYAQQRASISARYACWKACVVGRKWCVEVERGWLEGGVWIGK